LLDQIIEACNIKGLHHQVGKIQGVENLRLWKRLNSFRDGKTTISPTASSLLRQRFKGFFVNRLFLFLFLFLLMDGLLE